MKLPSLRFRILLLVFLLAVPAVQAFPPAPNSLICGMVKDQLGTPLQNTGDTVILQTPSGAKAVGFVQPNLAVGINYAITVPMDTGLSSKPYVTNALTASAPYLLYVVTGTTTNLPIEMTYSNKLMGKPAQIIFQDLTLGTDTNGDGIPDEWEKVFLSQIGTNLSLASLNPNRVYAKDGRTLHQEFLLGNYPFNPSDHFSIRLVSRGHNTSTLAFTTMTGRTYTALGSADLQNWTPLTFKIPANGNASQSSFYAPTIQDLTIATDPPTNGPEMRFFRVSLQ